jgi:MFS family permease
VISSYIAIGRQMVQALCPCRCPPAVALCGAIAASGVWSPWGSCSRGCSSPSPPISPYSCMRPGDSPFPSPLVCRRLLQGLGLLAMGALVVLLLMPAGTSYVVLAAVIVLFGMSGLSWGGVYQTLAVELAGRESAGLGSGIAATFVQVGSTVTSPLFGYLADVTGSYTVSWSMLVLWLLLGIGLLGPVRPARPFPPRKENVHMCATTAAPGNATPAAKPTLART